MEENIFHYVDLDNITIIRNDIILNPKIDMYTLGVYIKLKYLSETGKDLDEILTFGSEQFIRTALERLRQENYIKGEFSWDNK